MAGIKIETWYAKEASAGQGLIISEADGRNVAVTYDKKDAPLAAAAPDLLAACYVALATLDLRSMGRAKWTGGDQKSYELLSAAIRKAEGRA